MRDILADDYIWANGLPMNESQLWRYNYVQGRINAFILGGLPVPETYLNESARIAYEHMAQVHIR
jgi:hypothetical protein